MARPALLCDIGKVLADFDFNRAASAAAPRCRAATEGSSAELNALLEDIKLPYENGDMDDETFLTGAKTRLGFEGSRTELTALWCDIFTPNAAMEQSLRALKQRHPALPMHLLSNTAGLHLAHLQEHCPALSLFDGGVFSHLAKASKPGQRIFEIAIEQCQLEPAHTLFIDDLPANIATAKAMGFAVHHYDLHNHQAFEHSLEQWLRDEDLT